MLNPETLHPLPVPTVCGKCGVEEHSLLFQICQGKNFPRLCTTCVLRLHPRYFCPTCFAFYGSTTPSGPEFVNCTKCDSVSHYRCTTAKMGPFICPLCVNPNSPIFVPKKAKDGRREIDLKAACVLFAAACIAASTMEKGAEGAKLSAENKAREAAVTREIAKKALEDLAYLEASERLKMNKISTAVASGSGTCTSNSYQLGVDGPSEVSVRLNAVGLRENERFPAFRGPIAATSGPKPNGAVMGMEDRERRTMLPSQNLGGSMNSSSGLYSVPPGQLRYNSNSIW